MWSMQKNYDDGDDPDVGVAPSSGLWDVSFLWSYARPGVVKIASEIANMTERLLLSLASDPIGLYSTQKLGFRPAYRLHPSW